MVVVSRNTIASERLALFRLRENRQQRARAVLLHLHGGEVHLERAGGVERIHHRSENLRVHVVDLALEHDDLLGRAAARRSCPTMTRSTFGVSAGSRSPAP